MTASAVLSERLGFKASKPLRLTPYDVMTRELRVAPGAVTPFAGARLARFALARSSLTRRFSRSDQLRYERAPAAGRSLPGACKPTWLPTLLRCVCPDWARRRRASTCCSTR
jgi:hypothetical protein